jgi:hypothetical protein
MSTILYDTNVKTIHELTLGTPVSTDELMYWDAVNSAHKKVTLGSNVGSLLTSDIKSNMVTALANSLNWGRTANEASLSQLTTDVITTLPNVGDYAVFASTATNIPTANLWYIACVAGGSSVIGARYMAYRTGGYVYFGYIATAGTITWIPIALGTTNISTIAANLLSAANTWTGSQSFNNIKVNNALFTSYTPGTNITIERNASVREGLLLHLALTLTPSASIAVDSVVLATTGQTYGNIVPFVTSIGYSGYLYVYSYTAPTTTWAAHCYDSLGTIRSVNNNEQIIISSSFRLVAFSD